MAVVEKGPTQVQEVLAKGPVPDPFPTLDVARNDPARLDRIRQIRKLIDEKGIKYIFFQQVSVSGHVNGKGVAASSDSSGPKPMYRSRSSTKRSAVAPYTSW